MASMVQAAARSSAFRALPWTVATALRAVQAAVAAPSFLFLGTLIVMLFRPPAVNGYWLDRAAFLLLVFVVLLRALALRQPLSLTGSITWPMLGLLVLAFGGVASQPYDPQSWSVFVAKWAAPFVLYHLAGFVFQDAVALRRFETFALVVLVYLSLIAVLFLLGADNFIFPRYILNQDLGIHADRARGPFLQAVANGVSLNLLGLIALDSYRRKRLRGVAALLFLVALPLAVLATKTRAVWLSFSATILVLLLSRSSVRVRRACLCLALSGSLGLIAILSFRDGETALDSRLADRGPVEFRKAVYQAGGQMLMERPALGWGPHEMQIELNKRISEFHQEDFYFHNTFLEIGVERGLLGLGLYLWLVLGLFRVGRKRNLSGVSLDENFLDTEFRSLWPVLVGVYLLNACFVVMNYQFVNGLLFTLAGMLAAQNRRADAESHVG
jgi:O-antigen ligase